MTGTLLFHSPSQTPLHPFSTPLLPSRGISAIVWLMVYYLIPLSTMVKIVRTKDASSIYMPLAFAAALNGGLWTVYGLVRLAGRGGGSLGGGGGAD